MGHAGGERLMMRRILSEGAVEGADLRFGDRGQGEGDGIVLRRDHAVFRVMEVVAPEHHQHHERVKDGRKSCEKTEDRIVKAMVGILQELTTPL